nr:putative glycerol-3-phosphate transporter 4 [Ipomoea batatas]
MSGEVERITKGNPSGISLIRSIRGKDWSFKTYRYVVLFVTFIAYTSYHASRKPSSIVKSVLDPKSGIDNATLNSSNLWPVGDVFVKRELELDLGRSKGKGWEPFNGKDGTKKLGEIDVAFLACYSIGMYVAGHLGDSLDLRLFLTAGMIGSGVFVALFGMGYFWNIHEFWFYLAMQMGAGLFQATGWPSVVAVIGNWFDKSKRGLIMGVWNAHTSVGNISGSLLAAAVLDYGWGWSFILPGAFIFVTGLIVFLFLPAYPEDVGFPCENAVVAEHSDEETQLGNENEGASMFHHGSVTRKGVGFLGACLIPGVIPFALCLFFSKMVAYTFLYWLPFYLSQTAIGGEYVSVKSAGNLSTLFDVGGIVGGILAGLFSDWFDARATTAASFMSAAIPVMFLYRRFGGVSETLNIFLMFLSGLCVNGPYALITTAVSADLGTHKSLRGDSRALATVTAIIDGTGSLGAALGPLLTGFLSTKGWDAVFIMLSIGALCAVLLLSNLVVTELRGKNYKHRPNVEHNSGAINNQKPAYHCFCFGTGASPHPPIKTAAHPQPTKTIACNIRVATAFPSRWSTTAQRAMPSTATNGSEIAGYRLQQWRRLWSSSGKAVSGGEGSLVFHFSLRHH